MRTAYFRTAFGLLGIDVPLQSSRAHVIWYYYFLTFLDSLGCAVSNHLKAAMISLLLTISIYYYLSCCCYLCMEPRLTLNLPQSFCFSVPHTGVPGICHHVQKCNISLALSPPIISCLFTEISLSWQCAAICRGNSEFQHKLETHAETVSSTRASVLRRRWGWQQLNE